ncbi:hypothetical protein M426DRAFT_7528 [Hypoxylon sp. CI-4A]|nr:hypothetical protein M426DRAFT_7528 [Hypoxylon sp. CI-4A]
MKSIKRFLCLEKSADGENRKPDTRPPPEGLTDMRKRRDVSTTAIDFIPQCRGRKATLAWLNSSSPSNLNQLLNERDRAKRQTREGPKTLGTKEVHLILREPCIASVRLLYSVCRQAEVSNKYGIPGEFAYNFSKSVGLDMTSAPRLPSLQLTDFGEMMKEHKGLFSSPRCLSPISEPGGWRDLSERDLADYTFNNNDLSLEENEPYSLKQALEDALDEETVLEEAEYLTITKIPIYQKR